MQSADDAGEETESEDEEGDAGGDAQDAGGTRMNGGAAEAVAREGQSPPASPTQDPPAQPVLAPRTAAAITSRTLNAWPWLATACPRATVLHATPGKAPPAIALDPCCIQPMAAAALDPWQSTRVAAIAHSVAARQQPQSAASRPPQAKAAGARAAGMKVARAAKAAKHGGRFARRAAPPRRVVIARRPIVKRHAAYARG